MNSKLALVLVVLVVCGIAVAEEQVNDIRFSISGIEPGMLMESVLKSHPELNFRPSALGSPVLQTYVDERVQITLSVMASRDPKKRVYAIGGSTLSCSSSEVPTLKAGLPLCALGKYFTAMLGFRAYCFDSSFSFDTGVQEVQIWHDWKGLRSFHVSDSTQKPTLF